MEIEDIEENYKQKKESLEKEFIDNVKAGKGNLKELDANYRKKIQKVRETYYKQQKSFIKQSKPIKKKKRKKKEEKKVFSVKHIEVRLTKMERARLRLIVFGFRFKVFIRNAFSYIYYPGPAYIFKKLKYIFIKYFRKGVAIIVLLMRKFIIMMRSLGKWFISGLKKMFSKASAIMAKMFKKKEKPEKTDKPS